jgi:hypothetical protein
MPDHNAAGRRPMIADREDGASQASDRNRQGALTLQAKDHERPAGTARRGPSARPPQPSAAGPTSCGAQATSGDDGGG